MVRWFGAFVLCAALAAPGVGVAQEDPGPPGRQPLTDVPVGCPIPPPPEVVFVGTVVGSDYRTVRFNLDQIRAGDLSQYASNNQIDVRYGIDTKYLHDGEQYLVGAFYDANAQVLRSRVRPESPTFGGDEIIGATESDLQCPEVTDPMRTMHTDGTSIDSGVLSPFFDDRDGLLRSILVPVLVVCGAVLALAAIRWILTGFGRGVESLARTSSRQPPGRVHPRQPATAGAAPRRSGQPALPPGRRRR